MSKEIDYRRNNILLSKANDINAKLIDLDDSIRDHTYCNNACSSEFHINRIAELKEEMKLKKQELISQLYKIREELNNE